MEATAGTCAVLTVWSIIRLRNYYMIVECTDVQPVSLLLRFSAKRVAINVFRYVLLLTKWLNMGFRYWSITWLILLGRATDLVRDILAARVGLCFELWKHVYVRFRCVWVLSRHTLQHTYCHTPKKCTQKICSFTLFTGYHCGKWHQPQRGKPK